LVLVGKLLKNSFLNIRLLCQTSIFLEVIFFGTRYLYFHLKMLFLTPSPISPLATPITPPQSS
jgi:hypothetical protein